MFAFTRKNANFYRFLMYCNVFLKVLLEVLVRHNRLNSEKRLKLICTPLKSLQAKTVEIATNKFQAWWYVMCNVQENVENYKSMVFEPFFQFCFGPLFASPQLRLEPNEASTQVKRYVDSTIKNLFLLSYQTVLSILLSAFEKKKMC